MSHPILNWKKCKRCKRWFDIGTNFEECPSCRKLNKKDTCQMYRGYFK